MRSLQRDFLSLGSVVATHELLALGHSQMRLRDAVHHGEIVRVRKGWYSLPQLGDAERSAARVGGRLACVSAAVALRMWVPLHRPVLHVAVDPNSCQLRDRRDFRTRLAHLDRHDVDVHWVESHSASRTIVRPIEALAQICRCQPVEFAFVVCESALFMGQVSRAAFEGMLARQTESVARDLRRCCHLSESGTESMFAFRMRKLGLSFEQQVRIGPDRVDFVIGERLVIEIDSIEHHDPTADCLRDCRLSIRGYRVLRFMYSQIVDGWPSVQASVFAAISRGDHLAS